MALERVLELIWVNSNYFYFNWMYVKILFLNLLSLIWDNFD
jgi:hypothetical protein